MFQAVQLDTKDGISWSILGNAYLAHFFSVSQNPRTLKQAMSAYKQAVSFLKYFWIRNFSIFVFLQEKDIIALNTPELHHNKGIVSAIFHYFSKYLFFIQFTFFCVGSKSGGQLVG